MSAKNWEEDKYKIFEGSGYYEDSRGDYVITLDAALDIIKDRVRMQLPIKMYKAIFSFMKSEPSGGPSYWDTEIVPIGAKDESELQEKIANYLSNDNNGYHKHIKLKNIEIL